MDLLAYLKYAALHSESNGLAGRKNFYALRLAEQGVAYGAGKMKSRLALENIVCAQDSGVVSCTFRLAMLLDYLLSLFLWINRRYCVKIKVQR